VRFPYARAAACRWPGRPLRAGAIALRISTVGQSTTRHSPYDPTIRKADAHRRDQSLVDRNIDPVAEPGRPCGDGGHFKGGRRAKNGEDVSGTLVRAHDSYLEMMLLV
jgi:hypothetical protein